VWSYTSTPSCLIVLIIKNKDNCTILERTGKGDERERGIKREGKMKILLRY
jgi:hypothetical protein